MAETGRFCWVKRCARRVNRVAGGGFGETARGWSRILAVITAICVTLPAANVSAQNGAVAPLASGQIYEIGGIEVDVTAVNANAARDAALISGEKRAFNALMARLIMRADRHRIPELSRAQLTELIQDFEVLQEKASTVRYLATLSYRFNADRVRRLLRGSAIPFAETPSKQILVLPVFQNAGAMSLWDEPNPWRDAWSRIPTSHGLVPLMLPLGDLADIAAMGVEQAARGDQIRLTAIANRYGATDTLVAIATVNQNQVLGTLNVETVVTRYGSAQVEQTWVLTFAGQIAEGVAYLLETAALDIAQQIEDNWKRDNLIHFGKPGVASVAIPIAVLHDWVQIRKKLENIAVVTDVDLVLMSRREVRVNVHYLGEFQQLQLALSQKDLALYGGEGDWTLLRAGAEPPRQTIITVPPTPDQGTDKTESSGKTK